MTKKEANVVLIIVINVVKPTYDISYVM